MDFGDLTHSCPPLGFWSLAAVLANGVRCSFSQWCTSSWPFRSNQREQSIGRSPSEYFSRTPNFHNPFSTLFEPPFLLVSPCKSLSLCPQAWTWRTPSGHMCDPLPPTTMTELKTKMALRTHKGWLPKVFFALSSPPLSRSCDFAPFLAGDGVWCYGKGPTYMPSQDDR